jgi:hypothetical protein
MKNTKVMTTEQFFNLFELDEKEYIKKYLWSSDRAIGITILKSYVKSKFFKPAVTNSGSDDTLAMLKVYVVPNSKSEIWEVGVSATKISLYGLDKFPSQENPKDPDAPTKESSEKSASYLIQPINLEEQDRFTFNSKDSTFFDKKTKKTVAARFIIDYIYKEHIDTYISVRGYILQGKFLLLRFLMKFIEWLGKFLVAVIPKISGRKINNDAYNLILKPFYWENPTGIKGKTEEVQLQDYDNMLKKINPFTFSFVTGFILIFYILYYNFCSDFLNIISFIKSNKDDQIFSVALITFVVLFFNYIFPNFLLFILNSCVKIYKKLSLKRFEL